MRRILVGSSHPGRACPTREWMAHMLVVAIGVSCREPFGELAVLRGEIPHICDLLWAMGTSKESGEALEVEIEQAEPNQKDDLMVSRGAHFASWSFPPFKGQLHNVRCMIGTQQDANAQAFEMLSFRSPFLHDVAAPDLVDLVIKADRKSFQDEDFGVLLPALERIEQLKVTALVEIPWSEYGVELHQKYPVREKQGWFRSYWEHFRWWALLPPPPFPSFPYLTTLSFNGSLPALRSVLALSLSKAGMWSYHAVSTVDCVGR